MSSFDCLSLIKYVFPIERLPEWVRFSLNNQHCAALADSCPLFKGMYKQEFIFCDKAKERLSNSDDYQTLLKCLHIYSTEIITRVELHNLVLDLLGQYPDLMDEFNEFLERSENIEPLWSEGRLSKSTKVEDKDKEQKKKKKTDTRRSIWESPFKNLTFLTINVVL